MRALFPTLLTAILAGYRRSRLISAGRISRHRLATIE
jgi:hypothetical protein